MQDDDNSQSSAESLEGIGSNNTSSVELPSNIAHGDDSTERLVDTRSSESINAVSDVTFQQEEITPEISLSLFTEPEEIEVKEEVSTPALGMPSADEEPNEAEQEKEEESEDLEETLDVIEYIEDIILAALVRTLHYFYYENVLTELDSHLHRCLGVKMS